MLFLQRVDKYFRNRGGKQLNYTIKQYLKKFTWKQVLAHKHSEELEREIEKLAEGAGKGSRQYISSYQPALKALATKYESTLKKEYEQIAKSWSEAGPPAEQRPKLMEKHGEYAVLEFTEAMYRLFGMRVFVLGTYKGREGQATISKQVTAIFLHTCWLTSLRRLTQV